MQQYDVEAAGAVYAFDAVEFDVTGGRRTRDPGQWPASARLAAANAKPDDLDRMRRLPERLDDPRHRRR